MNGLCLQSGGISSLGISEISEMSGYAKAHDLRAKAAIAAQRYAKKAGYIIARRTLAILAILGWRAYPQVAHSIFVTLAIAMIDLIMRPFSMMQCPSDSMSLELTASDRDPAIAIALDAPSLITGHDAATLGIRLNTPSDDAGFGIIVERLPDNVDRNSLERSHCESSKFVWSESRAAGTLPGSCFHSRWRQSFQK